MLSNTPALHANLYRDFSLSISKTLQIRFDASLKPQLTSGIGSTT